MTNHKLLSRVLAVALLSLTSVAAISAHAADQATKPPGTVAANADDATITAKVKAVLDKGPKHVSPMGEGLMIPRPDLGVTKACNVVIGDLIMKQIVGGQPKLLDTLDWPKTMKLLNTQFGINLPTP